MQIYEIILEKFLSQHKSFIILLQNKGSRTDEF